MDWIVLSRDHEDRTGNVSFRVIQPEVSDLPLSLAAIENVFIGLISLIANICIGLISLIAAGAPLLQYEGRLETIPVPLYGIRTAPGTNAFMCPAILDMISADTAQF